RWAAVLVGAAVLGGVARPAEAQPGAAQAQALREAERLNAEAHKLDRAAQYHAALSSLERALTLREKAHGPDHPDGGQLLNGLAVLCLNKGNAGGAERFAKRALVIMEKALGPDHPDVARSLDSLASAYTYANTPSPARAEPLYQRALRIRE